MFHLCEKNTLFASCLHLHCLHSCLYVHAAYSVHAFTKRSVSLILYILPQCSITSASHLSKAAYMCSHHLTLHQHLYHHITLVHYNYKCHVWMHKTMLLPLTICNYSDQVTAIICIFTSYTLHAYNCPYYILVWVKDHTSHSHCA